MPYFTRLDVANRALQHLGVPRIASFTDSSRQAREANFAIDKLRQAELQRSVWTFATRRAVMREVISPNAKDIVFPAYASGTTYTVGDVVQDSTGFLWHSRHTGNLGNTPGSEGTNPNWIAYFGPMVAQAHSTTVAYLPGDIVFITTAAYFCITAHTNQVPPSSSYWEPLSGVSMASPPDIALSPIGYERDAVTRRKYYRLPANFLRMAPQDPKMASGVRQNTTAGMAYNDWEIEEPYLFSNDTSPFVMRFVADTANVANMHPLFCEVWAARMAIELADPLTQNGEKLQAASALYQQYMGMAQAMNAVEAGTTESEPSSAPPQQGR